MNDDGDDEPAAAVVLPRTDKEKINLIVTKKLWSDGADNVAEAMHSLVKLVEFSKSDLNNKANQKIAFDRGAPLALVRAMKRHVHSPEIQADGCFALGFITLCGHAEARQVIIDTGGIKACLRAMKRHSNHPRVQTSSRMLHDWGLVLR